MKVGSVANMIFFTVPVIPVRFPLSQQRRDVLNVNPSNSLNSTLLLCRKFPSLTFFGVTFNGASFYGICLALYTNLTSRVVLNIREVAREGRNKSVETQPHDYKDDKAEPTVIPLSLRSRQKEFKQAIGKILDYLQYTLLKLN